MKHFLKPWLKIILIAILSSQLSACISLVAGGAVVGGLLMADRRTSGTQIEDETIELRAISRLKDALTTPYHINTTSYNRQVLLTGEVTTDADRAHAEQAVSRIENVQRVVNELVMAQQVSALSERSKDTFITSKVKASFLDARDVFSNAFKVVTERNVVYLMGRVTQHEADRASDIARGIEGVQKVVRIFEIISENELKSLQTEIKANNPSETKVPRNTESLSN